MSIVSDRAATHLNLGGGVTNLLRMARNGCHASLAFASVLSGTAAETAIFPAGGPGKVPSIESINALVSQTAADPEYAHGGVFVRSVTLEGVPEPMTLAVAPLGGLNGRAMLGVLAEDAATFGQSQFEFIEKVAQRLSRHLRAREEVQHRSTAERVDHFAHSVPPPWVPVLPAPDLDIEAAVVVAEPPETEAEAPQPDVAAATTQPAAATTQPAAQMIVEDNLGRPTPDLPGDEPSRPSWPWQDNPIAAPRPVVESMVSNREQTAGVVDPSTSERRASDERPIVEVGGPQLRTTVRFATDVQWAAEEQATWGEQPGLLPSRPGEVQPSDARSPDAQSNDARSAADRPAAATSEEPAASGRPSVEPQAGAPSEVTAASHPPHTNGRTAPPANAVAVDASLDVLGEPDAVTGLPAPSKFLSKLGRMLGSDHHGCALVVVVIDVVQADADDEVVILTAHALRGQLRFGDPVARISAGVFATALMLVPGAVRGDAIEERLAGTVRAVLAGRSLPPALRSSHAVIESDDQRDADEILKDAVLALRKDATK